VASIHLSIVIIQQHTPDSAGQVVLPFIKEDKKKPVFTDLSDKYRLNVLIFWRFPGVTARQYS